MSPLTEYQTRLHNSEAGLAQARSVQQWLFIVAGILLMLSMLAVVNRAPVWVRLLPLALLPVLAGKYATNRSAWSRLHRLQRFYREGIARIDGSFAGRGFTGDEFRVAGHPYESDLNIFGTGSLFELLCTARTEMGRRRLASYLLDTPDIAEVNARQDAVRELAGNWTLREKIALLGDFDFRESSGETFSEWLDSRPVTAGIPVRITALFSSLCLVFLVVRTYFASPITLISWQSVAPWVAFFVAINLVTAAVWHRRTKGSLVAAKRIGMEVGLLREGIALIQRQQFKSTKLRSIFESLNRDRAGDALRRLERLTNALHQCDKVAFELPARVLLARHQLGFAIDGWKLRHGRHLKDWMDAWAEFESLVALSGYAWEHPSDTYPEIARGEARLEARDMGHPLLPQATCVANDFVLGAERPFVIISGSNMAGKSTLLRAVGVNVVLAFAGAPVRATSMKVSALSLCASLAAVDSILEGKSKFLAEVDRLRQMLVAARGESRVLFLIDEIFAGTNSKDRRIAAEAVVRALIGTGAIGALSTHDLALTEIADIQNLRGANIHMASRAASSDPMDFDYLLKPGVTRESNALAIAKMTGVLS